MADLAAAVDSFAIEQAIRESAPELLFASRRVVRRIARLTCHDAPLSLARPPHGDSVTLSARDLPRLTDGLVALPSTLPDHVAVVSRPDDVRAAPQNADSLLREYWRLAFHALLDLAGDRLPDGGVSLLDAETLMEARDVLAAEGRVNADASDRLVAREFIATFLELRCFRPSLVAAWFPAVVDPDGVATALSAAVGAEGLLARSLPPMLDPEVAIEPEAAPISTPWWQRWGVTWWPRTRAAQLRRRATHTALTGNMVRAALDEWRAANSRPEAACQATGRLERQIDAFARRLGWALDLDDRAVDNAESVIRDLVEHARGSSWHPAARLLFDLQKICVDSERESFRTQLIGWMVTGGRRPLAVPLPCQRLALIHRHAEAAAGRLPSLDLPAASRSRADRLLAEAVRTTNAAARETLRPRLEEALVRAGIEPHALVESAARDTLVEEILDLVMTRGFVSFGGIRDAISRNQLKLADLKDLADWLAGDELLRLDRGLAATLDGAYRAAPPYMTLMQRISSPLFGTAVGRLVTTNVLVPFGGAWVLLRGLEHIIEPITHYSFGVIWHIYTQPRMLTIGVLLWAILHLASVRAVAWQAARGLAAAVQFLVFALPAAVLRLPIVQRVIASPAARWFMRHVWSPLLATALTWLVLPYEGPWVSRSTPWLVPVAFAIWALGLNSAVGRQIQEQVVESATKLLLQFHTHVLVGLYSLTVEVFRHALDVVEGTLYAVDESLRFRSDESGVVLAIKAVVGAVWSVIESVVRFCVTLLIEPQLNPIKHFPVVTVSHKLLVPMIPVVASQLVGTTGMEKGLALTVVTFVSTALPGVFGFLAWEFKENWRLYAANRPRTLRPVPVGHHGETIRRLLLPGFHSGTIPKIFARLRRDAEARRVRSRAVWQRKEVEHDVVVFLNRHVIALMALTEAGRQLRVRVSSVGLTVRSITIALVADGADDRPLVLCLVRRDDLIESWILDEGWLADLAGESAGVVRLALAGYHRLAAADRAVAASAGIDTDQTASDDGAVVAVTPITWDDWRAAWERVERHEDRLTTPRFNLGPG